MLLLHPARAARPAVEAGPGGVAGVQVLHAHPLLAAGIVATLAAPARDGAVPVSSAAGPVIVTDFEQAMRQPHGVPVLVVESGLTVHKVRALLQAGTQGCISADGSATELIRAVSALRGGGNYFCPTVTRLLADALLPAALTRAEQRVLDLLCEGQENKTIAEQLQVALGTVKTHVKSMLAKTRTRTRTELVARAIRHGWVTAAAPPLAPADLPPPRCRRPAASLG